MPPAVAIVTLTQTCLLAMKKRLFEQSRIQFFGKCCLKNTRVFSVNTATA
jgi:hypothetical protein